MRPVIILLAFLVVVLNGCEQIGTVDGGTSSGTVCLWIGAVKDSYVSFGPSGQEVDQNFGKNGSLVAAIGPVGRKQSYVDFSLPTLPEGTEIVAAKLELYHGGKNEDGYTDDIAMNVARVTNEEWTPGTITWNNRPDRGGHFGAETSLALRSQNWSGTPDIAGLVKEIFANPSAYHGFAIWFNDNQFGGQQVEKGFYSDNDYRRTQNDLGLSPRLLVRIKLPEGKTTSDIVLPFLPSGHDLDGLSQPITTLRFVSASSWPTDWNVTPD